MADDIKTGSATAQDALAVELLNRGQASSGRPDEAEAGRSFGGDVTAESEAGGGAENVYLSGLLGEFSGAAAPRPDGGGQLPWDAGSAIGHGDPIPWTDGGTRPEGAEDERPVDGFMLSDEIAVGTHDGPLSTGMPRTGSEQESASGAAPDPGVDIAAEETAALGGPTYRSTTEAPSAPPAGQGPAAPAADGTATGPSDGSATVVETAVTTLANAPLIDTMASAPVLGVSAAAGTEDAAIALNIASTLGDLDGSETLAITIEGVPAGAVLSAGTNNGNGSWTLAPVDLAGLTITPAANSDGDFTLKVTATSTESNEGDTTSVSANLEVSVSAVADAPTLTVSDAAGAEDAAILLDITGALGEADGSETLSYTVEGVPAGAMLSAGTDNGDGSWTLAPAQLAGLTVTPAADSDGDFTLTVTATGTESDGGDTASVSADIAVSVAAVADAPTLTVSDAAGAEDAAILLDLAGALGEADGSESLSYTVEGVPAGAILSAGTDNGGGSWTLTPAQLAGLTVTPAADSDGDFTLTVTATSTEADGGDTASVSADIAVSVAAVADAPTLTVTDAAGLEDAAILLDVTGALGDADGSETLSYTIEGVPAGAMLSAGTDNGGGSWTLTPAQLAGLTVTPAADSDGDFTLTVTATSTEADGGDTASVSADIAVSVAAVADAPTLTVSDAAGLEDAAILLDVTGALGDLDGSETLSYTIEGVPAGAMLSAGIDNGGGSWTLTPAQLAGLTVTPPADSDGDFTLTVTATSTEADGGDTASVSADIAVSVAAVADAPTLTVTDAAGLEDAAILLDVTGALGDSDGSETLSYTVEGVPAGAILSAGTDNGGGSWTLTPAQLAGLTVTPPADSDGDFTLTVTATDTEADGGDTASVSADIAVSVSAVADAPTLTVSDAAGLEDAAILLDVTGALGDLDGSETLSYTIEGVPAGAMLSAGTDNGGGSWTLAPADLAGLTVTPPADSDGDFTLTVTATSTEVDGGDTASVSADIAVSVAAVADAPTLTVSDVSVIKGTPIVLNIASSLQDLDGSESLSFTIDGMPGGADLSAGVDNGDGSWTLTGADLTGLTLTPPNNASDFTLTVTATAQEADGGDTESVLATLDVAVFDDDHFGDIGGDLFEGRGGDDLMFGYDGNDDIYGDMAPDGLIGGVLGLLGLGDDGWGHDEIHGGDGNDKLYGGEGNDVLYGDAGRDRLYGEDGNDTLYGGTGNDDLYGGNGHDTFQLGAGTDEAWGGSGNDLIVFRAGDGNDNSFDGGAGWTDAIRVDGVNGDPSGGDWTLELTVGSVQTSGPDGFDLSADAAGKITMADGSELTFVGVERIEW